jgi:hypothetical protein
MLTVADFSNKMIFDLNKTFPIAKLQEKYVVVESEQNSVSIPVSSIYREYQEVKDYRRLCQEKFAIWGLHEMN